MASNPFAGSYYGEQDPSQMSYGTGMSVNYGQQQQQQQPQHQQQYDASYSTSTADGSSMPMTNNGAMRIDAGQQHQHEPMGAGMTDVDLSKYPEPKDSTQKIRGKSDIFEYFFGGPINRELLIAKAFYFFFFSAFGSLLPLMAIYFKNMGMTPTQAGILIGIRPFVGVFSAPFWADLADRFKKGKILLLTSLAAWIIFNVPIGFIRPPATSCLVYNATGFFIDTPKGLIHRLSKREAGDDYEDLMARPFWSDDVASSTALPPSAETLQDATTRIPWDRLMAMEDDETLDIPLSELGDESDDGRVMRVRRQATQQQQRGPSPMKPTHQVGMSPYSLEFAQNYNEDKHKNWVSPTFSYTIFNRNDIRKVFFLFLLLIVIGEFFCCPSLTLADEAVLNMLGRENGDQYGRQRMFASVGWGLTMFVVCLILNSSTTFKSHPCQVHERERNYTVCYVTFTTFMGITMLIATRLPFDYTTQLESDPTGDHTATVLSPAELPDYSGPAPRAWNAPKGPPPPRPGAPKEGTKEAMGKAMKNLVEKSKVFASTTRKLPEWMPVLRHFANLKCVSFLFVAWFMGFGIGLIFTFLFWHLQDYGGTSAVFGMASVVNHISEIFAYFLSFPLIRRVGHIKVLLLGLLCNVLRFLYISYIREPWGVIPFELIQGVTHSAVWAAACSYITLNTPEELRDSARGVLSFIHNGAGRACGTIIGGMLATAYGTTAVLRGYGFACLFLLIGFGFVCYYDRQKGLRSDLTPAEDPHQVVEEMAHLAPHGVPGNPTIVRTPSTANLNRSASSKTALNYSVNQQGNLDIPGGATATNPFLSTGQQGGGGTSYYGNEDFSDGISMTVGGASYAVPTTINSQQQQQGYNPYNSQY